jgi:hypothetical protein
MLCYFLDDGSVEEVSENIRLLKFFNPETSLYLFEPGTQKDKEPYFEELDIATLATVSPDRRRYKEFCKNRGIKMYMPVWTKDDLITAGQYLLKNKDVPNQLEEYYSSDSIAARFNEYNGIFRHVLPIQIEQIHNLTKERKRAIQEADIKSILNVVDLDPLSVSHYLMIYDVNPNSNIHFFFLHLYSLN